MFTLLQDLRYAVRTLLKKPGFALIAIVILALGIGRNTALISIVNAILFRPRPVAQPERLVEHPGLLFRRSSHTRLGR
jgi:putative ABC transport system permease protein